MTLQGIGSHQSARILKDEWLTPPEIIDALGPFALDPCAPVERPWDTAFRHYTMYDNGLHRRWEGFVWLNPPYGRETGQWLARLAEHPDGGIALVFARTETAMFFQSVWPRASALLFLRGRLHFHHVDGSRAKANSGAPSVLVGYGADAARRLRTASASALPGAFVCMTTQGPLPMNDNSTDTVLCPCGLRPRVESLLTDPPRYRALCPLLCANPVSSGFTDTLRAALEQFEAACSATQGVCTSE